MRNSGRKASIEDRAAHIDSLAVDAAITAAHGDNKILYKSAKNLSAYFPPAIKTVNHSNGSPTQSPDEYDARWLEHFKCVFSAKSAPNVEQTQNMILSDDSLVPRLMW